jgi:hypothetical protein
MIARDKKLRTKRVEIQALWDHGVRMFNIGGKNLATVDLNEKRRQRVRPQMASRTRSIGARPDPSRQIRSVEITGTDTKYWIASTASEFRFPGGMPRRGQFSHAADRRSVGYTGDVRVNACASIDAKDPPRMRQGPVAILCVSAPPTHPRRYTK